MGVAIRQYRCHESRDQRASRHAWSDRGNRPKVLPVIRSLCPKALPLLAAALAVAVTGLVSGCVKDTTFNPYAKPDQGDLDQLQKTVNDRADLETATQQLTALDSQIGSVIARISTQTLIGPSIPKPDRGCIDPFGHTIGDDDRVQQIAARPAPTTAQFHQVVDTLIPILTNTGFSAVTQANSPSDSSTLAWVDGDGARIKLINSAGNVLLYDYSTGCRLPAAWRTSSPPADRRPIDDPDVRYPYLYESPGGRTR